MFSGELDLALCLVFSGVTDVYSRCTAAMGPYSDVGRVLSDPQVGVLSCNIQLLPFLIGGIDVG